MTYRGLLDKYGSLLDLPGHTRPVTLLEGNTPLIPAGNLSRELGGGFELLVKFEGLNPTGSFKDRGMTAAVSEALGRGAKSVICASTGNTAASAAAYAARAGLKSIVLIPQGKVAAGKLAGAIAYGAQVIQIDGSFDDALTLVVEITNKHPICLVNSINPYRIEGQKTSAFEICDTLGAAPDWLCLPVGNAGNITAYWAGFKQYDGINPPACRRCLACRRRAPRRWCWDIRWRIRRRWPPPSASGSRRAASRRSQAAEESRDGSSLSATMRSSQCKRQLAQLGGHLGGACLRPLGWPGLAHEIAAGTLRPQRQTHRRRLHRARIERPRHCHQGNG